MIEKVMETWESGKALVTTYPAIALGLSLLTIGRWTVSLFVWLFV